MKDNTKTSGVIFHNVAYTTKQGSLWLNPSGNGVFVEQFATLVNPKLTIIAFGANDYQQQSSVATYKASVKDAVNKALARGSKVLLVNNGLWFSEVPTDSLGIKHLEYEDALYEIADECNVSLCDINARWRALGRKTFMSYLQDGTVHPNDDGHKDIKKAILSCLLVGGSIKRIDGGLSNELINDRGGYFDSKTVNGALQELGFGLEDVANFEYDGVTYRGKWVIDENGLKFTYTEVV
jgi:hypothetical protein